MQAGGTLFVLQPWRPLGMVEFQAVTGGGQGLPGNEAGPWAAWLGPPGVHLSGASDAPPHCELSGCLGAGPVDCQVIRERWSGEA